MGVHFRDPSAARRIVHQAPHRSMPMRARVDICIAVVAVATGCVAGRVRPAPAAVVDEHAGHDMTMSVSAGVQPGASIPASGATAADRLAKSPRHGEWVAIKVGATDSVMAWVVYPERRDKAPVV